MLRRFQGDFDPLDLEILERAFEGAWRAIRESDRRGLDTDEELEAALRHELIEIARLNDVTDPEILRDILVTVVSDR